MSDSPDFDLDAATLRADGGDLSLSIEALASKLEQALPGRTEVRRRGGGLLGRGAKRVSALQVELGSVSYTLQVQGERVESSRQKVLGGIAIKRESLDPGDWVRELTETLRAEAERSAEAQKALSLLLG